MIKDNVIVLESGRFMTAIFKNPGEADVAYRKFLSLGYDKDHVNLIMSDSVRTENFSSEQDHKFYDMGSKSIEGLGIGALTGGTLGGIAAAIAALGTVIFFPTMGITISGPLAAALAGAGAGGTTGGLIGALVGGGFPNEKAQILEEKIKEGWVAIVVKIDAETIHDLLLKNLILNNR